MESHELKAAWDDVAAGYDDHVTEPHFPLAERALTAVGLKRGISFLDVASGSGRSRYQLRGAAPTLSRSTSLP